MYIYLSGTTDLRSVYFPTYFLVIMPTPPLFTAATPTE